MGHVLRGRLHLRAQPSQEHLHGLRGRLHLRPPPSEDQVQGLQATPGASGFDESLSSGFYSQNGRWPDPKSSKQEGGAGYFPNLYTIRVLLLLVEACVWREVDFDRAKETNSLYSLSPQT
jgi:hypothetical protein